LDAKTELIRFRMEILLPVDSSGLIGVRRINHVLRFMSGLNAANTPNTKPTATKVISTAIQLLTLHHGRNDQVSETSEAAGQVDAQTHSAKIRTAATSPAIKPTTKAFLRFGYMVCQYA